MRTNRQALEDVFATAAAILSGVRWRDGFCSLASVRCFAGEDGQKLAPTGVMDRFVEACFRQARSREPPKSRKATSMQRQQRTPPDEETNQPLTTPEEPERPLLCIRAVQPADAERLFYRLSPRTLYQRFLLPIPLAPHQAYRVTNLGKVENGTSYAAVVCDGEEIRGIARYDREPAPETVELSLLIEDAWQGRGLGKALAANMISEALRHGITQLTVTIQSENVPTLRLVKALFPQAQLVWNEGTWQTHLLAETAQLYPSGLPVCPDG